MKLKVTHNTILKQRPVQSTDLPANEKFNLLQGGVLDIDRFIDQGNHLHITLAEPLGGETEWYVFEQHIDLLEEPTHPVSKDQGRSMHVSPPVAGRKISIPGRSVYLLEPIIEGGHFTWDEATKSGSRIPESKAIVNNILMMAERMEQVRSRLGGHAIKVTSWYRDSVTNARVGGARQSQHLLGLGVDFYLEELSPQTVQQKLESSWTGGMGYGRTFTHLDGRSYKARFNYGA